jgi:hypothetical protein
MKSKNPLYVVKGKTVLEAQGMLDLLIKKFNLGPTLELLTNMINFLLSQVKDYATFVAIKKFIDDVLGKLTFFAQKFA